MNVECSCLNSDINYKDMDMSNIVMMDGETGAKAEKARKALIKMLSLCNCTFPVIKMSNGNGHSVLCPAHPDYRNH